MTAREETAKGNSWWGGVKGFAKIEEEPEW